VKKDIPIVFGPIMHGKSIQELENLSPETPALLSKEGVKLAITSDHPARPIEYLNYHAALAARNGLDWYEALKSLTIYPAEILGISDKVGSLEKGKDADIIIFSDDPLEFRTKVEKAYINGEEIYPLI
jgi:imidazolonepropionase-like amidohydrolase